MSSAVGQPFVTVSYDYGYRHTKNKIRAEDIVYSLKMLQFNRDAHISTYSFVVTYGCFGDKGQILADSQR